MKRLTIRKINSILNEQLSSSHENLALIEKELDSVFMTLENEAILLHERAIIKSEQQLLWYLKNKFKEA